MSLNPKPNRYPLKHLCHSESNGKARARSSTFNEGAYFDLGRTNNQNQRIRGTKWRECGDKEARRPSHCAVHRVPQHRS